MNNVFVNSILAITGMAVVIALGILNMVRPDAAYTLATEPHGMWFGLLGLGLIIIFLCVLTVLYSKKPAAAWAALVAGTLLLYLVGGPHLFTFSLLGFTWAFAKIGCLSTEH